jgi:hypothetical protein
VLMILRHDKVSFHINPFSQLCCILVDCHFFTVQEYMGQEKSSAAVLSSLSMISEVISFTPITF